MDLFHTPPPVLQRPRFALWLWERGIQLREAAEACDCSFEHIRAICRPFNDPLRRVPKAKVLEKIVAWTDGEITAEDFYPPHLTTASRAEPAEASA